MKTANDYALLSKYRKLLMGFAALWIFVLHEWVLVFDVPDQLTIEAFIKRIGFCGVDIFFFLSALGLHFSVKSHSTLSFYYRRIRRLAIPFLAVALLRCVVEGWTAWEFVGNVSGFNFYTKGIYILLWFVPAIATLYLLFPLYHRLFSRAKNKVAFTAIVLAIWLLESRALIGVMREDLYDFTNRIPIFCVGCLFGYLSEQEERRLSPKAWAALGLMLMVGVILSYLTNYRDMPLLVPTPNCCVPNFLMTISLCMLFSKGLDLLTKVSWLKPLIAGLGKFLSFFGAISLEFYCVQEWLGDQLKPLLTPRFGPLTINLFLFISITASGLALFEIQKGAWKLMDRSTAKP